MHSISLRGGGRRASRQAPGPIPSYFRLAKKEEADREGKGERTHLVPLFSLLFSPHPTLTEKRGAGEKRKRKLNFLPPTLFFPPSPLISMPDLNS